MEHPQPYPTLLILASLIFVPLSTHAQPLGTGPWECSGSVSTPVQGGHIYNASVDARGATRGEAEDAAKRQCSASQYQIACRKLVLNCRNDASGDTYSDGLEHLYWCGTQEGINFFGGDDKMRPAAKLRSECEGKEGGDRQQEARARVHRMTDDDIARAVDESQKKVLPALLYNMSWCLHGDTKDHSRMVRAAQSKAWGTMREEWYFCQAHTDSVVHLDAVVSNEIMARAVACAQEKKRTGSESDIACVLNEGSH